MSASQKQGSTQITPSKDPIGTQSNGVRHAVRVLSQATRVYVLPFHLKLDERAAIEARLQRLGAVIHSAPSSNVFLTAAKTWPLPARHLMQFYPEADLPSLTIVKLSWLEETERHRVMADTDAHLVKRAPNSKPFEFPSDLPTSSSSAPTKRSRTTSPSIATVNLSEQPLSIERAAPSLPAVVLDDSPAPPYVNSRHACLRPTPLVCVNDGLIKELEIIHRERQFTKDQYSALSYGRAISALKAYPHDLSKVKDPAKFAKNNIIGVGDKVSKLIKQYFDTGKIPEARTSAKDPALRVMASFQDLYGVGAVKAMHYYNQGCRTVEDVVRQGYRVGTNLDLKECLDILPDLLQPIPRAEIEHIADEIAREMEKILPGCTYTICGSYRRGKSASSDADIIITHPFKTSKGNTSNGATTVKHDDSASRNLRRTDAVTKAEAGSETETETESEGGESGHDVSSRQHASPTQSPPVSQSQSQSPVSSSGAPHASSQTTTPLVSLEMQARYESALDDLVRVLKDTAAITHTVNVSHSDCPTGSRTMRKTCFGTASVVYLAAMSAPSASDEVDGKRRKVVSSKGSSSSSRRTLQRALHRRVDIIFCTPDIYGAAVAGYTGSKQFERDLRIIINEKGLAGELHPPDRVNRKNEKWKFHSHGITRNEQLVETHTEREVFEIAGIPYMPPHLRNCDA